MPHLFSGPGRDKTASPGTQAPDIWDIRKKLLAILIPAMLVILTASGLILNYFSNNYIKIALGRNSLTTTLAQAHDLESLLEDCRQDIVALAHTPMSHERLRDFMEASAAARGQFYAEAAYVGESPGDQYVFLKTGEAVEEVPPDIARQIKNSPLEVPGSAAALHPGQVALTDCAEVRYPLLGIGDSPQQHDLTLLRLTTPVANTAGGVAGYLILSIDARTPRNILSLYTSPRSPLLGFDRAAENRRSFLVDSRGWMLFQSESIADPDCPLSVAAVRTGLAGQQGKPGSETAFHPDGRHAPYWRMVTAIQQGRSGLERGQADFGPAKITSSEDFVGYAPVRFRGDPKAAPAVVGGVIYIDRSLLPRTAEFSQFNVLFLTSVGAVVAMAALIVFLGRVITRPIQRLTAAMQTMRQEGRLRDIDLPDSDLETATLKRAVNGLIAALLSKELAIKDRDARLRSVRAKEKAALIAPKSRKDSENEALEELVGDSPAMDRLFARIRKVAASDADVLLVGETGTGKELTAEAIHRLSHRADRPFVSINCGALDENLLMDALFGHTQGAFSEAKTERKGAFLAADSGTLLLDEIGNASPRVQQALLRALAVRRITPLGSDGEIPFDTRVIAATNGNLKDLAAAGSFREDLYYRLQVLTIDTPPLRERHGDIPILAGYFLALAARHTARKETALSRGALDKLLAHSWPGNVRELKNCLIRAATLAERELILAEDVHFEEGGGDRPSEDAPDWAVAPAPEPAAAETSLNARQRRALVALPEGVTFSRQEYQDAGGSGLPSRTAQHDLQDLVNRGIVRKEGRGPATRYRLARHDS